ncbi:MAG: cytochrome P450 [Acidimicrobiales bacterium]
MHRGRLTEPVVSRLRGRGLRRGIVLTARAVLRPTATVRMLRSHELVRAHPDDIAALRAGAVRAGVGVVAIAVWACRSPRLARIALVAFPAGLAATEWWSRIGTLRLRDAPPGRLTGCPEMSLDRDFGIREAQRRGPVFSVSGGLARDMVCVLGLERGRRLLADHADGLASMVFTNNIHVPGGFIRTMRGDQHRHYRRVLARALSAHVLGRLEGTLGSLSADLVAELTSDGHETRHSTDVCERALLAGWLEIFFGIDRDAPVIEELIARFESVDVWHPLDGSPEEVATFESIDDFIVSTLRRGGPRVDRSFIATLDADGFDPTGDPTLLRNLVIMSQMTSKDTAGLIGWCVWFLAHNPQWVKRVRDDAAMLADPSGVPAAAGLVISETLRLAQSEFVWRDCTRDDVTVDGFCIPRGWVVRICVAESHRDPAVFDHPDEFDPGRFEGRKFTGAEYSPFGLDGNSCLGEGLVRRFGARFVTDLCVGYDLEVSADGPVELSRWRHWAPSRRFRLAAFGKGQVRVRQPTSDAIDNRQETRSG